MHTRIKNTAYQVELSNQVSSQIYLWA